MCCCKKLSNHTMKADIQVTMLLHVQVFFPLLNITHTHIYMCVYIYDKLIEGANLCCL